MNGNTKKRIHFRAKKSLIHDYHTGGIEKYYNVFRRVYHIDKTSGRF
jgi:hypothetical protein